MGYCHKYTSKTTHKIHLKPDTSLHNRLMKLATLNIQSVRNTTDIIIDFMHDLDTDILCITETWYPTMIYLYYTVLILNH